MKTFIYILLLIYAFQSYAIENCNIGYAISTNKTLGNGEIVNYDIHKKLEKKVITIINKKGYTVDFKNISTFITIKVDIQEKNHEISGHHQVSVSLYNNKSEEFFQKTLEESYSHGIIQNFSLKNKSIALMEKILLEIPDCFGEK